MPPRKRTDTTPDELPEGDATAPESAAPEIAPEEAPAPEAPQKSDLQVVEKPCGDCFPNGWPELGYAVGCEHGTWTRDQL